MEAVHAWTPTSLFTLTGKHRLAQQAPAPGTDGGDDVEFSKEFTGEENSDFKNDRKERVRNARGRFEEKLLCCVVSLKS